MELRIANIPLRIFKYGSRLFRLQIIDAKRAPGAFRKSPAIGVEGIIPDIAVPVRIDARLPNGKENFVGHACLLKYGDHFRIRLSRGDGADKRDNET